MDYSTNSIRRRASLSNNCLPLGRNYLSNLPIFAYVCGRGKEVAGKLEGKRKGFLYLVAPLQRLLLLGHLKKTKKRFVREAKTADFRARF